MEGGAESEVSSPGVRLGSADQVEDLHAKTVSLLTPNLSGVSMFSEVEVEILQQARSALAAANELRDLKLAHVAEAMDAEATDNKHDRHSSNKMLLKMDFGRQMDFGFYGLGRLPQHVCGFMVAQRD